METPKRDSQPQTPEAVNGQVTPRTDRDQGPQAGPASPPQGNDAASPPADAPQPESSPHWYEPVRSLLDHNSRQPPLKQGWNVTKDILTIALVPLIAYLATTWINHRSDERQRIASQEQNHQAIFDNYVNNLKEISLSDSYDATSGEHRLFIERMTLPTLRELSFDEFNPNLDARAKDRKAQLILFLYGMGMIGCDDSTSLCDREQTAASQPIDLATADLKFSNFRGYKLPGVEMSYADLRGADLSFANLRGANLQGVDLSCVFTAPDTWVSRLPLGGQLERFFAHTASDAAGASPLCANLAEANLTDANLEYANFKDAAGIDSAEIDEKWRRVWQVVNARVNEDEKDSILVGSDLNMANLRQADLAGYDLTGAILGDADLAGARLTDAKVTGAILTGANLTEAELSGADLTDAILTDADLTDAELEPGQLDQAVLCGTTLPDGGQQDRDCPKPPV